jgi:hypothetical protein
MRLIQTGSTDQSAMIRFMDASTGLPVTTVVTATAGLTITYRHTGAAAVVLTNGSTPAINDLAALTTAHTDAGLKHIADGWYRFDLPDDATVSGVTCVVSGTATGMVGFGTVLQLVPFNPQSAVDLGLSTLSTLLARIIGTLDTGTHKPQSGDTYTIVSHTDYGNAKLVRSTTPANTLTVDTSHRALSDLASILGTALTETAGLIAAAFSKFFNKATPTGNVNSLPDALPGSTSGLPLKSDLPAAAPTAAAIRAEIDSNSTQLTAIKTKTDQLTFTTLDRVDATATVDAAAIAAAVVAATGTPTVAISSTQASQVAIGSLAIRAYHTFVQSISSTSTAALGTATKVWLAIKAHASYADSTSVVFLEKTAGLTVLASASYATAGDGTLVITGTAGSWIITISIDEAATALLAPYDGRILDAEVKALVSGSTVSVWDGSAAISMGIVQAIT